MAVLTISSLVSAGLLSNTNMQGLGNNLTFGVMIWPAVASQSGGDNYNRTRKNT
jgi:hypothetical protein